jgi:hypothetical protein
VQGVAHVAAAFAADELPLAEVAVAADDAVTAARLDLA